MLTSGELVDSFRSDMSDAVAPYMWSEADVFVYMNEAYTRFARLSGGIPDTSSTVTQIPIVAGEKLAAVSPLILRFRQAWLTSDGNEIEIVNEQDPALRLSNSDYGRVRVRNLLDDNTPGPVTRMVVGRERKVVKWQQVPVVNDTAQLSVYRLPLTTVTSGDAYFDFPDLSEEHIEHLLLHMKSRAYGRQDADTFDRGARDHYKAEFEKAALLVKAEWERYKYKPRAVVYGGL